MQRPTRNGSIRGSAVVRAVLGGLLLAGLAGCPAPEGVRPTVERAPAMQRAERLARGGDHAASARAFEEAAAATEGEARLAALVGAARQWLLVPSVADATRVAAQFDAVGNSDPRGAGTIARALVSAEVALAAGQPERALASLRMLGEPPPAAAEADVLWWRGRSQFALDRAVEGVRSLTAREQLLPSAERPAARQALWEALRGAAARGASLGVPRGTEPTIAGWLELARRQ